MTDNELNEAVARKLGWWNFDIGVGGTPEDKACGGWDGKLIGSRPPKRVNGEMEEIPNYCYSIAAAWEVVEFMSGLGDYISVYADTSRGVYICTNSSQNIHAQANAAPMAICLAFLGLP